MKREDVPPFPEVAITVDHDRGVTTLRHRYLEYWTKVRHVVGAHEQQTTCCCDSPGATRQECQMVRGKKTPCRCYCHHLPGQGMKARSRKAK